MRTTLKGMLRLPSRMGGKALMKNRGARPKGSLPAIRTTLSSSRIIPVQEKKQPIRK